MSDDIKLPKGIEIVLKQATGFFPVTMYTADQLRAAVLADREGRHHPLGPLTAEDIERQYKSGVHIGSGLPMETCPCGFCKYRGRPHFDQRAKETT